MSQEVMNELVDMSQEIIKLKDQNRELLGALKMAVLALNESAPIDQYSVVPYNFHIKASKAAFCAIAKAEGEKA